MPLRAFLGDLSFRTETVARVRERWAARQAIPLIYLKWSSDSGFASLAGTIAETQDPGVFVARTGIPLELALLCETLINAGVAFVDDKTAPYGFAMQCDDAVWAFGTEWLEAIAAGDDVSDVVRRFLPRFVRHILSDDFSLADHVDAEVRAAAQQILAIWTRELEGEVISRQEWRAARANVLWASEASVDPEGFLVADLVESLPWPLAGIAPEFPAICQKFLHAYLQSLSAAFLPEQDQADRIAWLVGARHLRHLRGEARFADASDEAILDQVPELKSAMLAFRQPDAESRMGAARHLARPLATRFLREQMDILLALLRERPG